MFEVADYIGIIAFSMSGFFVATRNSLDLLGVLIATFLTALGGGIIRDITINETPYTFSHSYPALIVLSVIVLMIIFQFHKKQSVENKLLFIISDSIGLISFSISGALSAMDHQLNLTGVLTLAFITAVGGGIARDIIINEIPFVFKTGFYGTIALLMALILYILNQLHVMSYFNIVLLFIVGVAIRIIAFYRKWSIPLR